MRCHVICRLGGSVCSALTQILICEGHDGTALAARLSLLHWLRAKRTSIKKCRI